MITARGAYLVLIAAIMVPVGLWRQSAALGLTGFGVLAWVGWEWLMFGFRDGVTRRGLRVTRRILDGDAPVATMWDGRTYTVEVTLTVEGGRIPWASVSDPVPFALQRVSGATNADGPISEAEPLVIRYEVECPFVGVARFEGVRYETADLHGLFAGSRFARSPETYRILPVAYVGKAGQGGSKSSNTLPPPGLHRLRSPGSGSELLDLRDYRDGDPPRTIAWKVSARRDKLITKDFESEVPVRVTLFLDVSSSVRLPSPVELPRRKGERPTLATSKPLDRLIDLAAVVLKANAVARDLSGLGLFDEDAHRTIRPDRSPNHATRLLEMLGDAAALGPAAPTADPRPLLPVAHALAEEVYPDLLAQEVNRTPSWWLFFVGGPAATRHRRPFSAWLHAYKGDLLLWGTLVIPLAFLLLNLVALIVEGVPRSALSLLGGLLLFGTPVVVAGAWLLFAAGMLGGLWTWRERKRRKQVAAVMCVTQGDRGPGTLPAAGGVEALMEDDDLFSLHAQAFLAAHQVPVTLPLYDANGRYLFALPEKLVVAARALTEAVSRGRDNELFVLMIDLLDLDDRLDPLLAAVRTAAARHHQVIVVVPWPADVPPPGKPARPGPRPRKDVPAGILREMGNSTLEGAYDRLRRAFAKLGVGVICAADEEAPLMILRRVEAMRAGRRQGALP